MRNMFSSPYDGETDKNWHQKYEEMNSHTEAKTEMLEIKDEIDIEEETIYSDPYDSNLTPNDVEYEPIEMMSLTPTNFKEILEAIKEIKLNNKTITFTAELFNIREDILFYYVTKFEDEIAEISFLDDEDLLEVVQNIPWPCTETENFSSKNVQQNEFATQQGRVVVSSRRPSSSSQYSEHEPLPQKFKETTNVNTIFKAIKDIKIGGYSIRGTARIYNIPKTSLVRYVNKFDAEVSDVHLLTDDEVFEVTKKISKPGNIFSAEQEKALLDHITDSMERKMKITLNEFRALVYNFACENNVHYPRSWDKDAMAQIPWCNEFRRRYSLSSLNFANKMNLLNQKEEITDTPTSSTLSAQVIQSIQSTSDLLPEKATRTNTFHRLVKAIKAIRMGPLSVRAASEIFNVPKTSLSRYLQRFDAVIPNILTINDEEILKTVKRICMNSKIIEIFSAEEEEELLDHIKYCLDQGNGKLDILKFRIFVYKYVRDRKIIYPSNWDRDKMAGNYWYCMFAKRHSLMFLNEKDEEDNEDSEELTTDEIFRESILNKNPQIKQNKNKISKKERIPLMNIKQSKTHKKDNLKELIMATELLQNDICFICLKKLPCNLSLKNAFVHKELNKIVHLKCAKKQRIC